MSHSLPEVREAVFIEETFLALGGMIIPITMLNIEQIEPSRLGHHPATAPKLPLEDIIVEPRILGAPASQRWASGSRPHPSFSSYSRIFEEVVG